MAITLWQIESENVNNRKLLGLIHDPAVVQLVQRACAKYGVAYTAGDPQGSFVRLFEAEAYRHPGRSEGGIPDAPEISAAKWQSHIQAACERLAAEILAELGIAIVPAKPGS